MDRRGFLLSTMGMVLTQSARAQSPSIMPPSPQQFGVFAEHGTLTDRLTPNELSERLLDSPAPAGPPGRWVTRASLPVPTSEFSGGAALKGRLHVVGGWIEHDEHYIYDPSDDRWYRASPLPRRGNHIPVASDEERFYALGGFGGPNRDPFIDVYAYEVDSDRWTSVAPLPRARGAGSAAVLSGRIHLVGGAVSDRGERTSVAWHEAYDPKADRWTRLAPLPGARDHLGVAVHQDRLYACGGRFNTPAFNTDLHHVYLSDQDRWEVVAPMSTARSGHGFVVYRDRLFAMGGEGTLFVENTASPRVFGQMESYDPKTDTWQHHAPMPTPRHGSGPALIGDEIFVVAGAPIAGGSVQSATNEAFALSD